MRGTYFMKVIVLLTKALNILGACAGKKYLSCECCHIGSLLDVSKLRRHKAKNYSTTFSSEVLSNDECYSKNVGGHDKLESYFH